MVKPGMRGAVEFGTAHRARDDGPIAGKTGTCSDDHTHLGWFGSFNDVGNRKLVVVVLLTGAARSSGRCGRHRRRSYRSWASRITSPPRPADPGHTGVAQICCR